MARTTLRRQITGFIVAGGTAAAANAGVGILLRLVLFGSVGYAISVAAGFTVGTVVSFVLNRSISFAATEGRLSRQAVRYVLAAIVGIGIAAAIASLLVVLLRLLAHGRISEPVLETVAHFGAIGLTTIYTFLAIKYYALRLPAEETRSAPGVPTC